MQAPVNGSKLPPCKTRSLTFQASSWKQVGCLCQADPAPSSPIWVLQACSLLGLECDGTLSSRRCLWPSAPSEAQALSFSSSPVNTGVVLVLIYFFVKIFLNDCSCSAILLRVQRLHISSDSAGTVKFFLSSRQHHSFSLSGTASRSSLGLEAFQSLKLSGCGP